MSGETYLAAGVDVQTLEGLKETTKAFSALTHGPQVIGAESGFAGVYQLNGYKDPVLVSSADGVGTKLKIGSILGHYESLGQDLVNLNVGDILTWGAKPIFFLDYLSMGNLDRQRTESLLRGMTWACREAGCALIGGDTSQTPGVYVEDAFDLAGFVVGAVERERLINGRESIEAGDTLVGIPSSGVHTNGFSLVRHVLRLEDDPSILYRHYDDLNHTLGEELLIPHRSYYPLLEPALTLVKGVAHITGGGMRKVVKMLPDGLAARLHVGSWDVHPIFDIIQKEGNVAREEMFRVFNMGMGMVLACGHEAVSEVQRMVPDARIVGEVEPQSGEDRVVIEGL